MAQVAVALSRVKRIKVDTCDRLVRGERCAGRRPAHNDPHHLAGVRLGRVFQTGLFRGGWHGILEKVGSDMRVAPHNRELLPISQGHGPAIVIVRQRWTKSGAGIEGVISTSPVGSVLKHKGELSSLAQALGHAPGIGGVTQSPKSKPMYPPGIFDHIADKYQDIVHTGHRLWINCHKLNFDGILFLKLRTKSSARYTCSL